VDGKGISLLRKVCYYDLGLQVFVIYRKLKKEPKKKKKKTEHIKGINTRNVEITNKKWYLFGGFHHPTMPSYSNVC